MDVNQFRTEILEDVHVRASFNGTPAREEFLALYTEALAEADELEDFEPVSHNGTGSHGRRIQIDGFCYDSLDNWMSFVLCVFKDTQETPVLVSTEAWKYFRRMEAFLIDACSGFIQENAEESSPGYGLALDIRDRYKKTVQRYKMYIVTDMTMSSRINVIPESEINGITVEYQIWDILRLQGIQESKTGKESVIIELKDFTERGIPCLEAGRHNEYTSYLCTIPGKVLADLYIRYGSKLLEGNVRSFLTARGKINKGIRNTILNEPDMFFAYNNGIAATAYSVQLEHGGAGLYITEITGLQIVNGGQTTASLASALLNDRERSNGLKDVFVPVKLSVVSPEKATEMIPNIARYANKQNKVSDADFFSNHPFHVRMEEISRRLTAPAVMGNQYGTHWYYERARGQYKQEQANLTPAKKKQFLMRFPRNQMFTKTELAKFNELYRLLPYQVSLGAQKNFIKFAEWTSSNWEKDNTVFNESFFKRIVCLNILFRQTDRIVKNSDWYELGYKAQVVAYTLSALFNYIRENYPNRSFDFQGVWSKQDITDATRNQIAEIARCVYFFLTSPKRGVQNVSEWAKRKDCWESARQLKIPIFDEFASELPLLADQTDTERDARSIQRQDNRFNDMAKVANYGASAWEKVLKWGIENRVFTSVEISLLRKTQKLLETGSGFPTERECARVLKSLEKARLESYPD